MRLYFTLIAAAFALQLSAQDHQIPLSDWTSTNSQSSEKKLIITSGDTLAVDHLAQSVANLTLDLEWAKKSQPATGLLAVLTYDDLVQETFHYTLQPDAEKDNWKIEPAYAKGRKLMDVEVTVASGSGVIAVTEVHYTPGGPVVDLTMNKKPQYIELRPGKTQHNDVLVIPYPINTPPHLADCNTRTVYFTASVASSDPGEMHRGAILTVFVTDYNQKYHDSFEIKVNSEPKEYSVTISPEREVKNLYFFIMQPAPGGPSIAIRQFRIEDSDIESID